MAVASVDVQENCLPCAGCLESVSTADKTMTNVLVGLGVMFY